MKYEYKQLPYKELKGNITVPKVQRDFVWQLKKRRALIETIKKGLPFGSFLLQKYVDKESKLTKHDIYDGRQRFSTLLDYETNRWQYINVKEINDEIIKEKIIKKVNGFQDSEYNNDQINKILKQKKLAKEITEIILNKDGKYATDEDCRDEIKNKIKKVFPLIEDKYDAELRAAIREFYKDKTEIIDLDTLMLPCIVFEDSEKVTFDEVNESFEKLNTSGVKLSKYELAAVHWAKSSCKVDDDDIINCVISKYKDASKIESNKGIQVSNFDEGVLKLDHEITIYEYAYAITELLTTKCTKLFKKSKGTEGIGFTVLTSIFNLKTSEMPILDSVIIEKYYKNLNLATLKDTIIESALEVEKLLSFYCIGLTGKEYFCFSLNQKISFIVTFFKMRYEIVKDPATGNYIIIDRKKDISTASQFTEEFRKFEQYIPIWALIDYMNNERRGSGDKTLDRLVIVPSSQRIEHYSKYFTKPKKNDVSYVIDSWIQKLNESWDKDFDILSQLFINYLFKKSGVILPTPSTKLDDEHIIPKDKFVKRGINAKGIYSVTNLTFIPESDNRRKKSLTCYEWQDQYPSLAQFSTEQLDSYLYPKKADIDFASTVFDITDFEKFKNTRKDFLINKFLDLFGYEKV